MRYLSTMTASHWLMLYAAILSSWVGLWILAAPSTDWSRLLVDLCLSTAQNTGAASVFAMWLLMSLAMMLPTALPAFATYDQIADAHGLGGGSQLVAGYAAIWIGFALVASTVQLGFALPGSPLLAAGLLIGAALYQVTPMKSACLSRCRHPLTFFMAYWDKGPWRMGVRLGLVCLGCCWALMALALIGGGMSLAFMALATVLMTLEKLSRGPLVPRSIALACLVAAGYLIGGEI